MIDNDFVNYFVDVLKENLKVYNMNASKTEFVVRCPYCGDSIKDPNHTHLYIELDNTQCFRYYCQKCATSGIVNAEFLKDINVIDYNLINEIEKINKKFKYNSKSTKTKSINGNLKINGIKRRKSLILPPFTNKKLENKKYEYISDRYSFELSPNEFINDYKVIFSFKNFVEANEIDFLNANDYMLSKLSKEYVGFLSMDESYIIFRNIDKKCDKKHRYYMYNIFNDDDGKRFYTTKSKVDMLSPKITLIMAEGPFDIIGIREYFYKDKTDNTIFLSVNGKGYNLIINYFARLGFLDMDIHIYSDSDVNIGLYKHLRKISSVMMNNDIRIFYNVLGKDYGVPLNEIKLKSNKLL